MKVNTHTLHYQAHIILCLLFLELQSDRPLWIIEGPNAEIHESQDIYIALPRQNQSVIIIFGVAKRSTAVDNRGTKRSYT